MKLQHLTVIFIIIVLPITLILSAYTGAQIDILTLQNQYDDMLLTATYDGIKAFQINASYNSLSNVSDALREDVESAISAFMQSLVVKMGVGGYDINHMKSYVPAILFTLYDGYYIYTPAKTTDADGKSTYEYMLKPYNYYTVRYKQSDDYDVVINYTLDNYIVVYGWIGGEYKVNSGYLVKNNRQESGEIDGSETLYEYAPYINKNISENKVIPDVEYYKNGNLPEKITADEYNPEYLKIHSGEKDTRTKSLYPRNDNYYVDSKSATKYYEEADTFTTWVEKNLYWVTSNLAMRNNEKLNETYSEDIDYDEFSETNKKPIFKFNTTDNDPEDSTSIFAQHKTAVIRSSIQDNLNQSITAYSQGNSSTYDYKLPKLDINEWDMVSTNVCMLTFLQGIPMKTKYYNNYALVQSTRNNLYVSQDSLYFISDVNGDGKADDGYYHKIDCPELGKDGGKITGYSNFDFLLKKLNLKDEDAYYKHYEQACYYCIVDSVNYEKKDWKNDTTLANRRKAYYTALAREKYRNYTATEHLKYNVN